MSNPTREQWLKSLKVGDEVMTTARGRCSSVLVITAESKHAVETNDLKFNRKSGEYYNGFRTYRIRPMTIGERETRKRNLLSEKIRSAKLYTLDTDTLSRIAALIESSGKSSQLPTVAEVLGKKAGGNV